MTTSAVIVSMILGGCRPEQIYTCVLFFFIYYMNCRLFLYNAYTWHAHSKGMLHTRSDSITLKSCKKQLLFESLLGMLGRVQPCFSKFSVKLPYDEVLKFTWRRRTHRPPGKGVGGRHSLPVCSQRFSCFSTDLNHCAAHSDSRSWKSGKNYWLAQRRPSRRWGENPNQGLFDGFER